MSATHTSLHHTRKPAEWPWGVCLLLLGATALSYLDRQALSVVAPVLGAELALDNAQLGLLFSAFFWAYSLFHIPMGWLLDRSSLKSTYGLMVSLWSLAQIGCGFARTYPELFAARVFLGGFETAGQTGAARIIARIVPAQDRAFANGIMMSGGSIGAAIAGPLMIWLAGSVGWRSGFMWLGAAGLVWTACWLAWFRAPAAGTTATPGVRTDRDRWGAIFRNPRFWACTGGAACTIPIIHIGSAWIPTYLVQQWKLTLGAGLSVSLFVIYIGLDLGFIGGGWLVRRLIQGGRGVARARKIVLAFSAAVMLAAAAVPLAGSPAIAVTLLFLLNVGRASWGAIFLAFNQDIAPNRIGFVAGVMGSIGSLAGASMVWIIGHLSNAAGFDVPFLMVAGLAVLGSAPMLLAKWED